MTALTIPRHQRDGCLYQLPPDARAALMHERHATAAAVYASLASDSDTTDVDRKVFREWARDHAADARRYFAQWREARRCQPAR